MAFLRNMWYAAAQSDEIKEGLFHRTIIGDSILMYRKSDGTPVAIGNICPHRFAPLHLGRRVGDTVECGYHGLVFDGTGKCVGNPHGNGAIPAAARVNAYPIVDRHRLLWIWMGEKEPDLAMLPDCSFIDTTDKSISTMDYMKINCNYKLVVDNILDLSHTDYLHRDSFGGNANNKASVEIKKIGESITVNRYFASGNLFPTFQAFTEYRGPVDCWQTVRWDPLTVTRVEVGATPAGRPHEEGFMYTPWHILTPETEASTHMFLGKARNFNLVDPVMDERMLQDMRVPIYNEDKPMLEELQKIIGNREFTEMKPVLLASDSAAVQGRRAIDKLVAAEQESVGHKTLEAAT